MKLEKAYVFSDLDISYSNGRYIQNLLRNKILYVADVLIGFHDKDRVSSNLKPREQLFLNNILKYLHYNK